MAVKRFKFLLRCLRFVPDVKEEKHCQKRYSVLEYTTVEEQLVLWNMPILSVYTKYGSVYNCRQLVVQHNIARRTTENQIT